MSGEVVLSATQARVHMWTELSSVLITVPFFFYASKRLPTEKERKTAFWLGVGALAVDGWLLWRYLSGTTDKPVL